MRLGVLVFVVAATMQPAIASAQSANEEGRRAFLQCRACHTLKEGEPDRAGPNLHGLFGARAGTVSAKFRYSKAMTDSKIVWSEKTLDPWIAKPAQYIKSNRMASAGVANPAARAALIAYLKEETR